jgi:hypothetical protein
VARLGWIKGAKVGQWQIIVHSADEGEV